MQILFLGTGPTKPTKNRTNSSILVNGILIDSTPQFLLQVKRENIKPEDIHAVLITHAHKDAIRGLGDLDKWIDKEINLYTPPRVNVNRYIKEFKNIKINRILPYKSYKILDKNIIPFRVIHYEYHPTLGKKFPTYGFKIDNLIYAEDLESIPKNSIKYFEKAEAIIADGAMWFDTQIRGHLSIDKTLLLAKRFEPKNLIIIQAGRTYPSQEQAEKEIQEYWKKMKKDTKTKIILSYDGMKFDTKKLSKAIINEPLMKIQGIYLVKPHAEMIWKNEKKLIVKSKVFKNMIDKPLYYMDNDFSYGILKITKIKPISINQFNKLREQHKITEKEKEKWWEEKEQLYSYEFQILDRFEDPKPIKVPKGVQTFIEEVKFLEETGAIDVAGSPINGFGLQPIWIWGKRKKKERIEKIPSIEIVKLIEDIKQYNPSKPNNAQLADDWRIINGWYATYKKTDGKGIKFSKETIVNLAKLIYTEIVKRVKEEKMKHEFKPEEMKPSSLELYKLVSGKSIIMTEWRDLDFLNNLDDFSIIKDCVSLIGSSVTQEHKPRDIDILVRMKEPENQFLKRAIEVRLSKMLPEELQNKLHFVWGEKEGPHDSFIPLYDLFLKRIKPAKLIVMSQGSLELLKPYLPMKPAGSAYYDLNKFIEALI